MKVVEDFLGQKRFAMVGVSHHAKDFSRALFKELCHRGYDVVPVNPAAHEIEGRRCFATVQEISPPVNAALLMTPPPATNAVVHDCAAAGISRVWMFRGGGQGSVSTEAVKFCESKGIAVVPGECPFMFLPGSAWFHRFHGIINRIAGTYPR